MSSVPPLMVTTVFAAPSAREPQLGPSLRMPSEINTPPVPW